MQPYLQWCGFICNKMKINAEIKQIAAFIGHVRTSAIK